MAGRDHGRTDGGETATGGTGFRFDGTGDDRADPGAGGRDGPGAREAATPGEAGEGRDLEDGGRARDERTRAALNERLAAVERAVTDADAGPADLSDEAAREARLTDLGDRIDDLESRVADLEAGLQAVRGYVGDIRAVNRDVERRAEAALAAAGEDAPGDHGGGRDPPVDDPGGNEASDRRGDRRDEARGRDPPGPGGDDVCVHCGRARHAAGTSGVRDAAPPDGNRGGERRSNGPGPGDDREEGSRPGRGGRTDRSGREDRRPDTGDGEPEAAPGMGADLDARADGYRPPTVAAPADDDESRDGNGPLARLRDAL